MILQFPSRWQAKVLISPRTSQFVCVFTDSGHMLVLHLRLSSRGMGTGVSCGERGYSVTVGWIGQTQEEASPGWRMHQQLDAELRVVVWLLAGFATSCQSCAG